MCPKSQGQASCAGCERWFCIKHLLEHRQELSKELDKCALERDQLHAHLIADDHDRQHPLFTRIDRWEARSIETIQQVAEQVRSQLRDSLCQSKKRIEEALRPITHELKENRKTDEYTERELQRWISQLNDIKEQLQNSQMVELMHDEDERSSYNIRLIQLRVCQTWKGKRDQCE